MSPISRGPQSLSPEARARKRKNLAAVLCATAALFVTSSLITYFMPYPAQPLPIPSALPLPRIPLAPACPSGQPCPEPQDVQAEGKARYFDDGLPPSLEPPPAPKPP